MLARCNFLEFSGHQNLEDTDYQLTLLERPFPRGCTYFFFPKFSALARLLAFESSCDIPEIGASRGPNGRMP
jgi:hypothetical protein